jgi:hypothetical protein
MLIKNIEVVFDNGFDLCQLTLIENTEMVFDNGFDLCQLTLT